MLKIKVVFSRTVDTVYINGHNSAMGCPINVMSCYNKVCRYTVKNVMQTAIINKMPCYRKDDHAMRPIAYMGGLKIFGSPWIAMPI